MKVCVIQPPYSYEEKDADRLFDYKMEQLEKCGQELDLIVLPEYSDVPYATKTEEETVRIHNKYFDKLQKACQETAKRCNAVVFFNGLDLVDGQYRNTTFAIDKNGNIVGKYYKRHIPPVEKQINIASDYTDLYDNVYTVTIGGIKYAFLTCYDFYFYEYYPRIANENVDIIIGCSLQRSDTHEASEIMCRFLAYNTNAYVVRCSVSFKEDSNECGASMIVSPRGEVLANMKGKFGMAIADIDPKDKYYKPAGFGRADSAHYQYIEIGRTPWNYRHSGSAITLSENEMPYPRVCAHRGFNTVAPENTMPAFGAAIGLGADEIEFDLWATKDGKLVSCHDNNLDRVSDGTGSIDNYTYEELLKFDFGGKRGAEFSNIKIVTFEQILKRFACHTIMNIHVKLWDMEYEDDKMEEIVSLIRKYDCADHVYFMTTSDEKIKKVMKLAPDIKVCVGHDCNRPYAIVDRAIELGAKKVQLFRPYFNKEMIDKAHAHGIRCNVFYSDDEKTTREYYDLGIDTILTNDFNRTDALMRTLSKEYRERKNLF